MPLHSCAEPNWWVKYGRRAAFESVWFGRLGLERQTALNSAGSLSLWLAQKTIDKWIKQCPSTWNNKSYRRTNQNTGLEEIHDYSRRGAATDSCGVLLMCAYAEPTWSSKPWLKIATTKLCRVSELWETGLYERVSLAQIHLLLFVHDTSPVLYEISLKQVKFTRKKLSKYKHWNLPLNFLP